MTASTKKLPVVPKSYVKQDKDDDDDDVEERIPIHMQMGMSKEMLESTGLIDDFKRERRRSMREVLPDKECVELDLKYRAIFTNEKSKEKIIDQTDFIELKNQYLACEDNIKKMKESGEYDKIIEDLGKQKDAEALQRKLDKFDGEAVKVASFFLHENKKQRTNAKKMNYFFQFWSRHEKLKPLLAFRTHQLGHLVVKNKWEPRKNEVLQDFGGRNNSEGAQKLIATLKDLGWNDNEIEHHRKLIYDQLMKKEQIRQSKIKKRTQRS